MIKTITSLLLFMGMMVFLSAVNVDAFGDSSFRRQQSQADDGFNELDEEFSEPEPVKPPPPKVIIRERIIIKEKLVPVPVPTPAPRERTPAPEPIKKAPVRKPSSSNKTVLSNGYKFTLKGCTLSGQNIACNLLVVRTENDAVLRLYPNSDNQKISIFDNNGNQYISNSTSLGSSEDSRWLDLRLIRSIATKMKIYFNNVSSETVSIAALEISASDRARRKDFKVQFRDVPLGS